MNRKESLYRYLNSRDDIEKLDRDLYVIVGNNRGRFPFSNSFLITGDETVLIDAGIGEDKLRDIDSHAVIDTLIISHPHPDHISGSHVLSDRRLLLPRETTEEVHDLTLLGTRFTGNPEDGKYWASLVGGLLEMKPLGEPDERYGNGDTFDYGTVKLRAILVPGHLKDHYCFYEEKGGTLLTTDIDFTPFGPWYGNPECSIEQFREGVITLMAHPRTRVCSSHRTVIEDEASAEFKEFLDMFDRQKQLVLELCKEPRSEEQLIDLSPFYNNKLFDLKLQRIFERRMVMKNIELLVGDGLLVEKDGFFLKSQ